MKIRYSYKNELFDDIRDIVFNNKLEINFPYIFEEYIPFQIFVSGRTIFKGVGVVYDDMYLDKDNNIDEIIDEKYLNNVFNDYLIKNDFDFNDNSAISLSGGVDSSVVALVLQPELSYTGFYPDEGYDETVRATEIYKIIKSNHFEYCLIEKDFIDNVFECVDIFCTPIAGMGSVMEFALLKNFLRDNPGVNQILFGNGGDEIFMGYFFNHFIMQDIAKIISTPASYMPNFYESRIRLVNNMIDMAIIYSLNRASENYIRLYSCNIINMFKILFGKYDLLDKLLGININIILPSLLHLNGQMCRVLNVNEYNPIANSYLINKAKSLNSPFTDIPKKVLRDSVSNMPISIRNDLNKNGFPIPFHKWFEVDRLFKEYYEAFLKRKYIDIEPYCGINRFSWGIFQTELFLRRFYK